MLELAVLGLLAEQPLHGYELKKRLSETLGPLWGISFGSLYPALRRLERPARSTRREADRAAAVDAFVPTGSVSGDLAAARGRRRRPTDPAHPQGLPDHRRGPSAPSPSCSPTTSADDERAFALKLSFCRYLEPDRPPRVPRTPPRPTHRSGSPRPASAPTRTIDRYTRSLLEHRARSTQHDLEWIDELIAEEHATQAADRHRRSSTA